MSQTSGPPPTASEVKMTSLTSQPENPFARLIPDQQIVVVPSFTLESGETLRNVPIAFTTQGKLSAEGNNAMVICHALTGSAAVADWWGPLLGRPGRAFDVTRFFIICLNTLGSPYGSASPVTYKDGDPSLGRYGPEFPLTTIRDDVNIHRIVVEHLGVKQIAAVVGGSMGGMAVLEWAYFGRDFVRCIAPIATSSRHSAWCISWGEAQRQSIYCDPKYEDGYYPLDDQPVSGLGAARMSALLTYRSRDSFQARFGRNTPDPSKKQSINAPTPQADSSGDSTADVNEHWRVHNEGHRNGTPLTPKRTSTPSTPTTPSSSTLTDPQFHGSTPFPFELPPSKAKLSSEAGARRRPTTYFSAQSYLRYQGQKFVTRFDANCYIAITRKLDTHDVSRGRVPEANPREFIKQQAQAIAEGLPAAPLAPAPAGVPTDAEADASPNGANSEARTPIMAALGLIEQPALVIGIQSDGLFTFAEQQELARGIPDSRLKRIESPEGHDAFLLQFEQVNAHLLKFFAEVLPDIMAKQADGDVAGAEGADDDGRQDGDFKVQKESTFGEAEVDDITAW